jgi:hypothetical protein
MLGGRGQGVGVSRLHFGVVRSEKSGVLTSCPEDGPVDVSHLAIAVGIDCRVVFDAPVWAACEPEATDDELLTMIGRDKLAKQVLARLSKQLERYMDGRVAFRCALPTGRLALEAVAIGDELDPALQVQLQS